nr:MAG TPA: hypothetical protein [Caudoviricetes sp.]
MDLRLFSCATQSQAPCMRSSGALTSTRSASRIF